MCDSALREKQVLSSFSKSVFEIRRGKKRKNVSKILVGKRLFIDLRGFFFFKCFSNIMCSHEHRIILSKAITLIFEIAMCYNQTVQEVDLRVEAEANRLLQIFLFVSRLPL